MIIRKLEFLNIGSDSRKVSTVIYNDISVGLVYVPDKGYAVFIDNENPESEMFLLETKTTPKEYIENRDKYKEELSNFNSVISSIFNIIYKDSEIKEYEKKHPDYTIIELMDKISEESADYLKDNKKLYDIVNDGFMKLDIDDLLNRINSLVSKTSDLENDTFENKFKDFIHDSI